MVDESESQELGYRRQTHFRISLSRYLTVLHAYLMNYKYIIMCRTDRRSVIAVRYQVRTTSIQSKRVLFAPAEAISGCSHPSIVAIRHLRSPQGMHPARQKKDKNKKINNSNKTIRQGKKESQRMR